MGSTPAPEANLERFRGFADAYDAVRPQPPPIIVDMLTQLASAPGPSLVVDLGCGTGLSTRVWEGRAERIIGIEPNDEMRRRAEVYPRSAALTYRYGLSWDTGLDVGCADIVTISQALHWMEPEPTFAEVARILRPGGVLAAYDCDWPPTMNWEAEAAYEECMRCVESIRSARDLDTGLRRWRKDEHLGRIAASGHFRYVRETVVHHVERGNANRLVDLARSQGSVAGLLKLGLSEEEIGLDRLHAEAARTLGDEEQPWYWSYRVRLGVR